MKVSSYFFFFVGKPEFLSCEDLLKINNIQREAKLLENVTNSTEGKLPNFIENNHRIICITKIVIHI